MLKYHIQTIEATAGAVSDFTFSNIPQEYDDLELKISYRFTFNNTGWYDANMRFNGSSANYTQRILYGTGSTVASLTESGGINIRQSDASNTANTFGSGVAYIHNYTRAVSKSVSVDTVGENNATKAFSAIQAGVWADNSPITSIQFIPLSSTFTQYSSISLYGIKRGSSGEVEVASGGTITTSGGYTIHTFTSSGTFVPRKDLEVEYVVVAGGGGAGGASGAASGAGGYRSSVQGEMSGGGASAEPKLALSKGQSVLVQVGAGGTGYPLTQTSGNNSSFASIVSVGGGRFLSTGGSGGGSAGQAVGTSSGRGSAGTPGQGFAGGDGGDNSGGGGGGAGGNGGSGSGSIGGAGGIGVQSSITGTATYRAGGGGAGALSAGGAGGLGGGGNGLTGNTNGDTSGAANTGGGAGSPWAVLPPAANGGSGVVIIRYPTPA